MKRFFLVLVMAVLCFSGYAQTQQGKSSVGLSIGYGFEWENATIGVDFRHSLTDEVRLAPSLTHYVKNDGVSAWAIDLNAHYVVKLNDMFGFYPLAGLNLSFWNYDGGRIRVGDWSIDQSDNQTRFGANIGLGGEVYATDQITVGLEVKYNIIKDLDQAMFAVRVGYNF